RTWRSRCAPSGLGIKAVDEGEALARRGRVLGIVAAEGEDAPSCPCERGRDWPAGTSARALGLSRRPRGGHPGRLTRRPLFQRNVPTGCAERYSLRHSTILSG